MPFASSSDENFLSLDNAIPPAPASLFIYAIPEQEILRKGEIAEGALGPGNATPPASHDDPFHDDWPHW